MNYLFLKRYNYIKKLYFLFSNSILTVMHAKGIFFIEVFFISKRVKREIISWWIIKVDKMSSVLMGQSLIIRRKWSAFLYNDSSWERLFRWLEICETAGFWLPLENVICYCSNNTTLFFDFAHLGRCYSFFTPFHLRCRIMNQETVNTCMRASN